MGATLRTVRMVEETLRTLEYPVKVADLKRALPRQVQHDTLKEILTYLANKHHILMIPDGILVTHTQNQYWQERFAEAMPLEHFREQYKEHLKETQMKGLHEGSYRQASPKTTSSSSSKRRNTILEKS